MNKFVFIFLMCLMVFACSSDQEVKNVTTFDNNNNLQAIVKVPFGSKEFQKDILSGNHIRKDSENQQIGTSPVNYGIIPSARFSNSNDSIIEPLEVMIIGKKFEKNEVVSIKPIGLLKCVKNGIQISTILGIPLHEKNQTTVIENFEDFSKNHLAIRKNLSDWFLSQYKNADYKVLGWFDEGFAIKEIEKYKTNKS